MFGSVNNIGKNAAELTGITLTKGSSYFLQRIIVPPFALLLSKGRSGSEISSEFREKQYSCSIYCTIEGRSHWKTCGSLKNTKEGFLVFIMSASMNMFLLIPSMFQVSAVSCWLDVFCWLDALADVAKLSDPISLNPFQHLLHQT